MDTSENKLYHKVTNNKDDRLNELFEASISGDYLHLEFRHGLVFLKVGQGHTSEQTETAVLLNEKILSQKFSSIPDNNRTTFFWKNGNFGRIIPCPHVKYRFQDETHLNDRLSLPLGFHLKTCLLETDHTLVDHAYIDSVLLTLIRHLHYLNERHQRNGTLSNVKITPSQIAKVKSYINEHITRKIFVFELADLLDVSEGYFYEAFKHTTNTTPYECITLAKMNRAKELLGKNESSIIQVGMSVGYDNPAHFCKSFKKIVGLTPKGYKKLSQAGNPKKPRI